MKSTNNRLLFNRAILNKLHFIIENNLDLRFGQILVNAEIITYENDYDEMVVKDPFNEESELVWNRMCNNKFCFPNE